MLTTRHAVDFAYTREEFAALFHYGPLVANGRKSAIRGWVPYELCVLSTLRDALRSGDIYLPHSRHYTDPETFLIPRVAWPHLRQDVCQQLDLDPTGAARLRDRAGINRAASARRPSAGPTRWDPDPAGEIDCAAG